MRKAHLYGGAGRGRGCDEVRSCTCAVASGEPHHCGRRLRRLFGCARCAITGLKQKNIVVRLRRSIVLVRSTVTEITRKKMDKSGLEPETSRMLSGRDKPSTPYALITIWLNYNIYATSTYAS